MLKNSQTYFEASKNTLRRRVAVGDYAAGPSHVLPTSGTARFASGLSCNDFLRANSILYFDREGLASLAPDIEVLATKEGLTAHRESVLVRVQ